MISRNDALERLRAYQDMSAVDPEGAHLCADSVLLEIIDDKEITDEFRGIERGYVYLTARSDLTNG